MLDYDPVSNLQHYPIAMRRFGSTPAGDSLYRIVFAPSRRYLIVGDVAEWRVLHKQVGPVWIMERWLPANEFHRLGKEDWDANMLSLGPWPEKGEYELCHVFDVAPPSDACIEDLVILIEQGRRTPFGDTLRFNRQSAEKEKLDTRATAEAMIRNRLPAYGSVPFVGARSKRGSKTAPIMRSAEELGLPTRPGMVSNGARRNNPVTRMIESAA